MLASPLFRQIAFVSAFLVADIAAAADVTIPNFWGPARTVPKPPPPPLRDLHVLVADDTRPFSFKDTDGALLGFDVDMARALCARLQVTGSCEVSALPAGQLADALQTGAADAVFGGIPVTAETRLTIDLSRAYFRIPARFVALKSAPDAPAQAEARVGVLDRSPHQAMFAAFFPRAVAVPYPNTAAMLDDLAKGVIDEAFGDGLDLALWLDGDQGAACCRFVGGPYLSTAYLGPGLSVATRPGNRALVGAIDDALEAINADGTFAELYLRWFPVGLY